MENNGEESGTWTVYKSYNMNKRRLSLSLALTHTHTYQNIVLASAFQTSLALTIIYLSCWFNFSRDLCFVMMTIIGWDIFCRKQIFSDYHIIIYFLSSLESQSPSDFESSHIHTRWQRTTTHTHTKLASLHSLLPSHSSVCHPFYTTCVTRAYLIQTKNLTPDRMKAKKERTKRNDDKINTPSNDDMLLLTTFFPLHGYYSSQPSAQWHFGLGKCKDLILLTRIIE